MFPFGRSYQLATDEVEHDIARQMMRPSAFRDRITNYCYIGQGELDPVNTLDEALKLMVELRRVRQKFNKAIRDGHIAKYDSFEQQLKAAEQTAIINKDELKQLQEYQRLRAFSINVDEFK